VVKVAVAVAVVVAMVVVVVMVAMVMAMLMLLQQAGIGCRGWRKKPSQQRWRKRPAMLLLLLPLLPPLAFVWVLIVSAPSCWS
jgi:hypothetical protein